MQDILEKIYNGDKDSLTEDILFMYEQEGFSIINFLYFAIIVAQNLFEKEKTEKERNYKKILLKSDFLLPDGIALQVFYFLAVLTGRVNKAPSQKKRISNLNGTDFVPYFLEEIKKKYGSHKICLMMYGAKSTEIEKAKKNIAYKGYNVIYAQDGYSEFDREKAIEKLDEYQDTINILLVAMSTPKIPIQELWTLKNYQKIQQNNLIVMNVGGLFDFWAGAQKRAPKVVRSMKLERLWRLMTDPKRNLQKVLNSLSLFSYIFRYLLLKND